MVESIVLVDLKAGTARESVTSLSLGNAKQLGIGKLGGSCLVLHVAANSNADLQRAVVDLAQVSGVTGVSIAAVRTP
jgi:hypothetical protein